MKKRVVGAARQTFSAKNRVIMALFTSLFTTISI